MLSIFSRTLLHHCNCVQDYFSLGLRGNQWKSIIVNLGLGDTLFQRGNLILPTGILFRDGIFILFFKHSVYLFIYLVLACAFEQHVSHL